MGLHGSMAVVCALAGALAIPYSAIAAAGGPPSSEIRKESNGIWLYVDGAKRPAIAGMIYQNTDGGRHVSTYANSQHLLYAPLQDESAGGQGHGRRLADMGIDT